MVFATVLALMQTPREVGWLDTLGTKPLVPVVARTGRYPLSDQTNSGAWEPYAPMSDEFEGSTLDRSKWHDHNPDWKGRQPAFFSPDNVVVKDGRLRLTMRLEEPEDLLRKQGYHTYSSAAVQSVGTVLYGYFEVKARPMNSHGSSAFWFYKNTPEVWTEIDVFEIGGGAPAFQDKVHMTVHVFHTPKETEHWQVGGIWSAGEPLVLRSRVYGLDWSKDEIRFYVDGVLVRKGPNTHWHQPLTMNFDSETMPDWFGLPKREDLPSTFEIDYVRAWKRKA